MAIIKDGDKYACEACIKGHRVSHCTHHDRDLVFVKKKGRPIALCKACQEKEAKKDATIAPPPSVCECRSKKRASTRLQHQLASVQESVEDQENLGDSPVPETTQPLPAQSHRQQLRLAIDHGSGLLQLVPRTVYPLLPSARWPLPLVPYPQPTPSLAVDFNVEGNAPGQVIATSYTTSVNCYGPMTFAPPAHNYLSQMSHNYGVFPGVEDAEKPVDFDDFLSGDPYHDQAALESITSPLAHLSLEPFAELPGMPLPVGIHEWLNHSPIPPEVDDVASPQLSAANRAGREHQQEPESRAHDSTTNQTRNHAVDQTLDVAPSVDLDHGDLEGQQPGGIFPLTEDDFLYPISVVPDDSVTDFLIPDVIREETHLHVQGAPLLDQEAFMEPEYTTTGDPPHTYEEIKVEMEMLH